ncbi:Hypothetical protein PHPALM_12208 [Phytophthora palmivora]|uniref:Uncharacterized protein n=1 Tax=Phytophthora palmivora TaxID=4796 RepID=A0A2P4Y0I4_9STRA|nr:Hypothetical protein PHPALM_12208 [Phytophthora palmivora]
MSISSVLRSHHNENNDDKLATITGKYDSGENFVSLYNPPRGRTATKFVHQWMGPMKIVEPAGYENYILQREDKTGCPDSVIAHVSFLVSYYYPELLPNQVAADIDEQLRDKDQVEHERNVEATAASVRTTMTRESRRIATTMTKRAHGTIVRENY